MDAFEQVVAEILWTQGYWVRTSVKVNLTKAEKVFIERGSSPRWDLDVVAYSARDNTISVVECKSYLDSPGVQLAGFTSGSKLSARFKLFNDAKLRETVFARLATDFETSGLCREKPTVRLCLACGNIQKKIRDFKRATPAERRKFLDWLRTRAGSKKPALAPIADPSGRLVPSAIVVIKAWLRAERITPGRLLSELGSYRNFDTRLSRALQGEAQCGFGCC